MFLLLKRMFLLSNFIHRLPCLKDIKLNLWTKCVAITFHIRAANHALIVLIGSLSLLQMFWYLLTTRNLKLIKLVAGIKMASLLLLLICRSFNCNLHTYNLRCIVILQKCHFNLYTHVRIDHSHSSL